MINCSYFNAVHWHNEAGTSTKALMPLDSQDPNGTSFQFASSTCDFVADNATSTVYPTFSYGEIVNAIFLLLIFSVALYSFFWSTVSRKKLKKHD